MPAFAVHLGVLFHLGIFVLLLVLDDHLHVIVLGDPKMASLLEEIYS